MNGKSIRAAKLEVGMATTVGRMRSNNEDAFLAAEPLFAVADGMGGHEAGEIASGLAIETLKSAKSPLSRPENLRELFGAANIAVMEAPKKGIGRVGMGTTLTAAVIDNDRLLIASVGDSRAYLLHDGSINRLTRDHSYVQELVSSGKLTESEMRWHPRRGVITRVLGFESQAQPDIYERLLAPGDRLLLCTDGLHGMLEDSAIESILLEQNPAQQCANSLVRAADSAGGSDNTTVVVIDIVSVAPPKPNWLATISRHLRPSVLAFLLAFAVLVGAVGTSVYLYAANSAYLIAEDGQVMLYRGLVGDVFGIKLQWQVKDTGIEVDDLAPPLPERLAEGIQLRSLEEAEQLLEQYRDSVEKIGR
jgi:protein phosphatase